MPIIRNPFRRAPGDHVNDENAKPFVSTGYLPSGLLGRRTESDSAVVKPTSIELPNDAAEYKLSEINDSGVYLPPSPGEAKSFWSLKSSSSRRSSHNHRNVVNENEPFNISRESFDSYRRSFDISARSPVLEPSLSRRSRQSLEARNIRFPSSQSFSTASFTSFRSHSLSQHPSQRSVTTLSSHYTAEPTSPVTHPTEDPFFPKDSRGDLPSTTEHSSVAEASSTRHSEDAGPTSRQLRPSETKDAIPDPEPTDRFVDVTLNEPKPKRHGLLYRFGVGTGSNNSASHNTDGADGNGSARPGSTAGHSFFGRKRGGSGQGAELGNMIRRPASRGTDKLEKSEKDKVNSAGPRMSATAEKTVISKGASGADKNTTVRPQTPAVAEKAARTETPPQATAGATVPMQAASMAPMRGPAPPQAPSPAAAPAQSQASAQSHATAKAHSPPQANAPAQPAQATGSSQAQGTPVQTAVNAPGPAPPQTHAHAVAQTQAVSDPSVPGEAQPAVQPPEQVREQNAPVEGALST